MRVLGRVIIAVIVIGGACAWLIFTGHWGGVIDFTEAVFGTQTAQHVDEFGHASKRVSDDVSDYGEQLYEQIKSGKTVEPDWSAVGDALGGIGKTDTARHPSYKRDEYGSGWLDPDGNHCDTRNDILARDLTDLTVDSDKCTVLTGVLDDPYTSKTIQFERGAATSTAVQIDHVVPLSLSWREGAWKWDDAKRKQFANDPMNLLAVDGPTNASKSDKGLSDWLPPAKDYRCTYIALYVAVHDKYDLAMSKDDKSVAQKYVTSCR